MTARAMSGVGLGLRAADLTYRGVNYRLRDDVRERGARVTYLSPRSMPLECSWCERGIKHGAKLVDGIVVAGHPACAIRAGLLVIQYGQYQALRAENRNLARDLEIAQQFADRDGGPHMIAAWMLRP